MKRFATMTAVALLAGTAAIADTTAAQLNQDVYAMGMATLQEDGYDVNQVRQDQSGSLTFTASNETNGRILIMGDDGDVMSDTMVDLQGGAMVQAMGSEDNDEGSLAVGANGGLAASTMTDSDDDEASASVGLDGGLDVGVSGSNDGDSGAISVGTGGSLGVSASGSDGADSGSRHIRA